MKSKNTAITIIGFVLFFFAFSQISFAEIEKVEVGINGLSCPFCVWGLKQQMKKIKTIEGLDISLKRSMARFTLKEKSFLNISEIESAVKKAGFSIRDIRIEAVGEIAAYGEFPALRVSGSEQVFTLDGLEEGEPGSIVLIEGDVHEHEKDKPYGLSIKKIKPMNDSF